MPKVYDDWERLVRATIRREEIWQLCHEHSRTPSGGSTASGTSPGSNSPRSSRNRVSPLNDQGGAAEVVPPSRPVLAGTGSGLSRGSTSLDVIRTPDRSGNELKKEKLIKRSKSRLRLDRWIWKRWISKAF